ncbi:MAG: transcriptional regulator [Erysipelotrichales bacterium]|nr:transcriptional regulator [Erysipelotrichales bacterium]
MSSSNFLAERRKELDLSQSKIADALGYSVQTISKWETGKSFPDLPIWGELAKVLQIDLDALINNKLKSKYNNVCFDNTFSTEKFASNLRRQRKYHDMTQKELAAKLGISYQTLLAWEKGTTFPNIEQFKILSKELNISYDDLYFALDDFIISKSQDNTIELKESTKSNKKKLFLGLIVAFVLTTASVLSILFSSNKLGSNASDTISLPNAPDSATSLNSTSSVESNSSNTSASLPSNVIDPSTSNNPSIGEDSSNSSVLPKLEEKSIRLSAELMKKLLPDDYLFSKEDIVSVNGMELGFVGVKYDTYNDESRINFYRSGDLYGAGYMYNKNNLGHIDSIVIKFSAYVSYSGMIGITFGDEPMIDAMTTYTSRVQTSPNGVETIYNESATGNYFNISVLNDKVCSIVEMVINLNGADETIN